MSDTERGDTRTDSRKEDALAQKIMEMVSDGSAVLPQDVAKSFFADHRRAKDPADAWRRYLNPVKQQMIYLARQGRVEIVRKKGEPVDPNDFRGVVRIRLPGAEKSEATE